MPFLSYHTKINTKASSFPGSCRNPVAGVSHPHVSIVQDPSSGQPTVTMVTSVNAADGGDPVFLPEEGLGGWLPAARGVRSWGNSTSPGPEHRLWPRCPGAGCDPAALGTQTLHCGRLAGL